MGFEHLSEADPGILALGLLLEVLRGNLTLEQLHDLSIAVQRGPHRFDDIAREDRMRVALKTDVAPVLLV